MGSPATIAIGFALLCACGGDIVVGGPDPGDPDRDPIGGDAAPPATAPTESDELYDLAAFPRFDLEIPPASIEALRSDPAAYAPATFRYGDEVVVDVGVRLKGEYTFRSIDQKASFKIKFDEIVPGQTFRGLHRMTFNNEFEDPSFVSERLTYLAFRNAGLPAPRANSALIYVNGELYGVYGNIETEDKTFLRRWFDSDEGNVYEEQGNDWMPGNEDGFELETNEAVDDRSDLTALFAAVNGAQPDTLLQDVSAILDTDRFLRYCALEGVVNQWDGYAYTQFGPNNYRLYHDPSTGRFSVLPWGMDMTMKGLRGDRFVDLLAPAGYLFQRCLGESPSCRARFEAVLAEEIDRFEALDLAATANAAYALIHDQVDADPRKEHTSAEFEDVFGQVVGFVRERPAAARAQL